MTSSESRDRFEKITQVLPEDLNERPSVVHFPSDIRELTFEPIYAIPENLIDGLKNRVNGLFTDIELDRERRFAIACRRHFSLGVFRAGFIGHSLLCAESVSPVNAKTIRELGWEQFTTESALEQIFDKVALWTSTIDDQSVGYLGWILTNPSFIQERDVLRHKWSEAVATNGFPTHRLYFEAQTSGQGAVAKSYDIAEFATSFSDFYKRWQLSRFVTWDLPEPLGANIGGPARVGELVGVHERPTVQVPAHVRLPVRADVLEMIHGQSVPPLAEWQQILERQQNGTLGVARFARVLHIQFYRNIVVAGRYSDRFARRTEAIDGAFAKYFGDASDDSVKKLRQWIERKNRENFAAQTP